MASDTIEAKFVADQLMEQGIPAIADKIDINLVMGGLQPQMWGYGPKVRVRQDDLPKAQAWLKAYEQRRKAKKDEHAVSSLIQRFEQSSATVMRVWDYLHCYKDGQ